MSANAPPKTNPVDDAPAGYEYVDEFTEKYRHVETGLTVEVGRHSDTNQFGDERHYRPFARDGDGVPVHDFGYGPGDVCALSRADAFALAREFCSERPDGELTGDEEVRL